LDNTTAAQPLVHTAFNETNPALSPDGQWLAYVSDETGRNEVYVRGLRTEVGRRPFSTNGGTEPRWTKGGRELFYRNADSVFLVAGQAGGAPAATPRLAS